MNPLPLGTETDELGLYQSLMSEEGLEPPLGDLVLPYQYYYRSDKMWTGGYCSCELNDY